MDDGATGKKTELCGPAVGTEKKRVLTEWVWDRSRQLGYCGVLVWGVHDRLVRRISSDSDSIQCRFQQACTARSIMHMHALRSLRLRVWLD